MSTERLLVRDAIGGFAPGQIFRAVLLLTYGFDGPWLEESLIPDLFDRPVASALVIRDRNAIVHEAHNVRYHRANAIYSNRTFHSKLALLVAEDRALAVIGSANLTRGGLERNLELGSVFEVSPTGGPRRMFRSFLDYVAGPLMREVAGAPESAVRDTVSALREVLRQVPRDVNGPHTFLHNYERALWEHVMEALPHRHVAKVSIISPFFEPNCEVSEDPTGQGGDEGIFARLFQDLTFEPRRGEKPVSVFFQQWEGKTQLPVDKLKAWNHQLELHQKLLTTVDGPRPLHGKMLIIEGAKSRKREPYLVTVFGSPNFTSAALLSRPPEGNAEIAVLTYLPSRRNATRRIWSALGLDTQFGEVTDWSTLRHVVSHRPPIPSSDAFRVNDASLRVADRKLVITWQGFTSAASQLRILIEVHGVWTPVSLTALGAETTAELDVPALIQTDEAGLVSVRAALIRVELLDQAGKVVAVSEAPINVDCPQQFCGCAMIGQLMSALDQRIAFAGCGIAQTYREQLKFLEQYQAKYREIGKKLAVLTHQADLDRFFRNLHTGFRGIKARSEAMPNSEYTFRRSLRDLDRWFREVLLLDGEVATNECRLFLIDRLGTALQHTLDLGRNSKVLAPKLAGIAGEFQVATALRAAFVWVESNHDERLDEYIRATVLRLNAVAGMLNKLERK
jgi:hypothetical protein